MHNPFEDSPVNVLPLSLTNEAAYIHHNKSDQAHKLLRLLADLSNQKRQGVLSGQNAGHSIQFTDPQCIMGYHHNFQRIINLTGQTPAILSVDYEHDQYTPPEYLSSTNRKLIEHANLGGMITINWSPLSPWLNDGLDLVNARGSWLDARTPAVGGNANFIALRDLLDPLSPIHEVWIRKLDHIANALDELNRSKVAVLWRPMQEMNGHWFWWGASHSDEYAALWRHMHQYFTQVKKLNNLLWVYSPAGFSTQSTDTILGSMCHYPGDDLVDIIAPTSYSDDLLVKDYENLSSVNKPIALAEYGPAASGPTLIPHLITAAPTFNAQMYAERLKQNYPRIAYWVSWNSFYSGEETKIYKYSLADCQNTTELFADEYVVSLTNLARFNDQI